MKKLNLKNSALIVIDMQRYFCERSGGAFLKDVPAIIPNVAGLIDAYRIKDRPIIFTRHAHKKGAPMGEMGRFWGGDLLFEGARDAELIDDVLPLHHEIVLTKTKYSAFAGTRLDAILKKNKVSKLVICGVMTNVCVETTARHAFIKDYEVIIAEDACAGRNKKHHDASILNLRYAFADVRKTSTIVSGL